MRGMNRFNGYKPWMLDEDTTTTTTTTTTYSTTTTTTTTTTRPPTTTTTTTTKTPVRRFQGFNTNSGLDRGSSNRDRLQSFFNQNRPPWANSGRPSAGPSDNIASS